MRLISSKHCASFLVFMILVDVTYSTDDGTLMESGRRARVSGRIVKLYSGLKPDPVLCLGEGFQKDAADCSVFYRCLKASNGKYAVYRFQCGPGTIYDPETEICNHPRSTKRFECGGSSIDKLTSSTDKFFENELDGLQKEILEVPSPISTKAPTTVTALPNKSESTYITTPYPWATTSTHRYQESEVVSTVSYWNEQAVLSTKNPRDHIVSEVIQLVSQQPSTLNMNLCTADGFMGDSEDCRKFYRCVNNQHGGYIRYEFSCSDSTIWDDDNQGCNHPWAVQRRRCGKGNSYAENNINYLNQIKNDDIVPNETIHQQSQISYGSKVTQSQLQVSNGAALQNQTQINFGDRLEQKKPAVKQNQTQISFGSSISQSQTQINYSNKATQTQLQVDHSNQSSQVQIQIAEFSTPSTTILTSTQYSKDSSNSKCTKEGFMGNSNDCKKFYRCIDNGKRGFNRYEFSCSEGTLWDKKLEACNHAWAVKECGAHIPSLNIPSTTTTVIKPVYDYYTTMSSSYFNNEIPDEIGYGNQNNNEQEQEKPKSSTQTTNTLPAVTSESSIAHETDCKLSGFFGNNNDCSKFYRCVENGKGGFTKYEYKCGEGTVWDSEIESCNHAWAVKQCNSISQNVSSIITTSTEKAIITTVSLIQSTTQTNIHENDYDSGYGSLQKETPPPLTTSTERIIYQEKDCTRAGFMGDDNDCRKFYRCVENDQGNFTRHEFTCGEGTVWDSKIQSCNHRWAVEKCGENEISDSSLNQVTMSHVVTEESSEVDNGYNTHIDNGNNPSQNTTTTITTTTNVYGFTNKDSQCYKNGFMGDKSNCKRFYRCVENGNRGFIRYEFSCGDGTVWDPKISACNHAWAVENCGGTQLENENIFNPSTIHDKSTTSYIDNDIPTQSSTQHTTMSASTMLTPAISTVNNQCISEGFIGDKYDCKKFYRCVADGKGSFIQYDFSCGEGTVWDPKVEACNHAREVESCRSNLSPVSTVTSSTSSATIKDDVIDVTHATQSNQDISNSTESNLWTSSTIKSPTFISDSKHCTREGFVGDSNNCRKFYRCVNDGKGGFTRYEFTCSKNTIWDSEINACNHVHSVKAPCSSLSAEDTKEPESSPTSTLASSPFVINDYSTTLKPEKSQECEQEGFIGDKKDCKKFYRCIDNGTGGFHKYEFSCGQGTTWDQKILACNHESSDRQCSATNTESYIEINEPSVSYSTSIPLSTTEATDKSEMPLTKDKCTSEGFYPNSNDCKKFYRCVSDGKGSYIKYDFACGEGTVWVQDIQACDHANDESYCKEAIVSGSTSPHSSTEQPLTTTSMSISSTTNKVETTVANEYGTQNSQKPGSSKEDICQSEGFYPSESDCKKFYQCVSTSDGEYVKHDFACREGTAWDTNKQSCNYINEVERCHNSNNIEVETKTTMQDESASESSYTTETLPNSSTPINATTQDSCVKSGFFGNTKDCKKFYRCVDNSKGGFTKYDFTCGDGTIWDQDIIACNHPQDVSNPSCNNNESSTTIITTTTPSTMSNESSETTTKSSTSTDSSTQTTTTTQNSNQSSQEDSAVRPNNNYTCTKAGFYADPYDCKKFYRCVDWGGDGKKFSIFHFDCGEGTIWDPEVQTCNYENSVYPPRNCSGTEPQKENNNETITTEGTTTKQEATTELTTTEGTSATTATQSTTQKSTTLESSTTTESSSATDQTTTQQSSVSEQTSSTQQSTTQQSTTEQSIPQQSTTDQGTTQQSTTISEQATSQQSSTTITEQTTSQQSSTTQQATEQTTNQLSTTTQQAITTEQTTSQQSSTTQQATTTEQITSTTTEQPTITSTTTVTTTEQPITTTTEEAMTTSTQTSTSESTTAGQTTKAEEATTQESNTEQSSENQSSTTEQSSTTQESTDASTTTESGQNTSTEKESSEKECPQIEDDQYLYVCPTGFKRHPKYCNLFYQCTEDEDNHDVKVAVFNCPNNTIYDESKIQCVEEEKADKKCDGQIAQKRRVKRLDTNYKEPITVSKGSYSCPTVGHFPFEKSEECSPVLFKCEATKTGKLRGLVYQCPEGYVYWAISRRCEPIATMTDCKQSHSHWNGRYEIPTERKNVARKN